MTPLLSLSRVSKTFENGTEAFGPVDIAVREGEFVSLLGPSGCGKSTALRVIAGLLAPSAGEVVFPQTRPEIGFVFQEPTLMPWASALANVRLPLDLKGIAGGQAHARAQRALERVSLGEFADAFPRELSGGMKMRVSIARALAAAPKLLLMDEPFAALDEPTRHALNDDLLKLWREDGLTVLFVTHSVFESTFLSTRVVVMTPRPGRIAADIALASPAGRDESFRLTSEFSAAAAKVSAALHAAIA
ncbi:MAG: ABC transporter ATP-binding protein [Rhizomicrobium sp.]